AARTVWTVTDAAGTATFSIVGGGTGGTAGLVTRCASVTVDGVPLPSPIVSVFDLDGRNGVDAMDLCIFAADLFSGQYCQRGGHEDGDGRRQGSREQIQPVGEGMRALLAHRVGERQETENEILTDDEQGIDEDHPTEPTVGGLRQEISPHGRCLPGSAAPTRA